MNGMNHETTAKARSLVRRMPAPKGDPEIPVGVRGHFYFCYGVLCRAWYSRRERTWCATVYDPRWRGMKWIGMKWESNYEGPLTGCSVVGRFDSPDDAAEGAASLVELRGVKRLTTLRDIDAVRRERKAGLI